MNVIKESHESIIQRKNLEQEKRRIMNMDFKSRSNKADWERLNRFLQEKQTATSSMTAHRTTVTPKPHDIETFYMPRDG